MLALHEVLTTPCPNKSYHVFIGGGGGGDMFGFEWHPNLATLGKDSHMLAHLSVAILWC